MTLQGIRSVTERVTACDQRNQQLSARDAVSQIVYVITRLEEAGSTLLALPMSGFGTGMRVGSLDVLHEAIEAYGYTQTVVRPSPPSAGAITRMDEALAWLSLIPSPPTSLRYIAGARSLVHPVSGRHLFSWRRLGEGMRAHHSAVQRWHTEAIHIIVSRLYRDGFIFPA